MRRARTLPRPEQVPGLDGGRAVERRRAVRMGAPPPPAFPLAGGVGPVKLDEVGSAGSCSWKLEVEVCEISAIWNPPFCLRPKLSQ